MTVREIERLAKLEQKFDDLNQKVDDGFKAVMDRLDKRSSVTRWTIGTIITIVTAFFLAWEAIVRR